MVCRGVQLSPPQVNGAVHLTDRRRKMAETKTETKTAARKINPWKEDFVNVFIPKRGESDEDYQFVAVNGHTFQIQKDIDVAVPRPVYEILKQRTLAIRVADRAIKKAQDEFLHPPVL